MQLPPHDEEPTNSLTIGAECTISLWVKPANVGGNLFTKQMESSPYTIRYAVTLSTYTPQLVTYITDYETST